MSKRKNSISDKRRAKRIHREQIRKAMNKRVFFTLTGCPKKLQGFSHKYCYKSNMHNLIYKDAKFQNVRYQSSIITNCNFNQTVLMGVDFCNCNLKKSSFKGAKLHNVCFINCNISGVDFTNAEFDNVIFVCTNIDRCKSLNCDSGWRIYRSYPKIELPSEISVQLLQLSKDAQIYDPHVLHVTKSKLNFWSLKILVDLYGADALRALCAINNRKNKSGFYTLNSYMRHIEKYLKL